MQLIFRNVNVNDPADIEQFNRLMDQLTVRAKDQNKLLRHIAEANSNPDKYLLVAEDPRTGTLCGSALGVCFGDFCDTCNPVMVIENVVTDSSCRNKGVASAILAELEAWGRSKQAMYAILCSANHRLEAHQLYEKNGYDSVKGYKKYL